MTLFGFDLTGTSELRLGVPIATPSCHSRISGGTNGSTSHGSLTKLTCSPLEAASGPFSAGVPGCGPMPASHGLAYDFNLVADGAQRGAA